MKHLAVCIDYDGCVCTTAYIYPFTPENIKDISTNTSIIDINNQLWQFILELCRNNSDLEKLSLVPFSARQSATSDAWNSWTNETESYFLAMTKIAAHVTELLKANQINIMVELNCLLMPDIYNNRDHGHTFKKALEDIDYSPHGKGMIKINQPHDDFLRDESKVSFVFSHVHAIDAEAFYYLDDRLDIHKTINNFYSSSVGSSFIPRGVKIILCHYDNGNFEKLFLSEIIGTGEKCYAYAEILKSIREKEKSYTKILPNTNQDNLEQSIEKFDKVFQEHVYENLLKLTPAQFSFANSSPVINDHSKYEFDLAAQKEVQSTPLRKSLLSGFIGFWEPINGLEKNEGGDIKNSENSILFRL